MLALSKAFAAQSGRLCTVPWESWLPLQPQSEEENVCMFQCGFLG